MPRKRRQPRLDLTGHLGLKTGDRVELALDGLLETGDCTSSIGGAPVHVMGGLPGERVVVEIVRVFPERVVAKVVSALKASPDRVIPGCEYFMSCTGCQFQHVSYSRQLEIKRERVSAELSKWPALASATVLPTLPSPLQSGYRNHARFTVRKGEPGRGSSGFVNAVTRHFVRIDKCQLMQPGINAVLAQVQGRLQGMSQFSVRTGARPGDSADAQSSESLLIQPQLPGEGWSFISGQKHLVAEVSGRRFRVAGSSFFQVNTLQLERMTELVRNGLRLTGAQCVVDAYCGAGTFSVLLAPYAAHVIGIEDSASAVDDARRNAAGLDNVEFRLGRAEDLLPAIEGQVDAVVLDPPRVGCHPGTINAVKALRPRRVAIVSCEPSALARDLAALCDGSFDLEWVQPVDVFPLTRHVEAVAILERAAPLD